MNQREILALYDKEQRRDVVWADSERMALPRLVRHVTKDGRWGIVLYSDLDAESADEAIRQQLDYFRARGMRFEWKVHSHDQPADLRQRLAAQGIETDEEEAVMVLDLATDPSILREGNGADVRRIENPDDLSLLIAIEEEVWGRSHADLGARMRIDMEQIPDQISVYLAYVDDLPVAGAWTYFHPGAHFASIWGGSTLPSFRKRGLYTALLAQRAREAHARGVRFLNVDAGPMSRPILARHGFEIITYTYPCEWRPDSPLDAPE